MTDQALSTAVDFVDAPLLYKGKVRELYDLGEHFLMVVTDRISAFDYVLRPPIPGKGKVLNLLSKHWFEATRHLMPNHLVHTEVDELGPIARNKEALRDRIMVVRKADRIDIECIVRGYITGGGWRQYEKTGAINGISLPEGMRKNEKFSDPIFTPSAKNDVGHDEDISFELMRESVGGPLADELREKSLQLYRFGAEYCDNRGILLADCKFEFGMYDGKVMLIDEIFTPDASRFWAKDRYALDTEIDSMDKEPVRTYLAGSSWDKASEPDELPLHVVEQTSERYRNIYELLTTITNKEREER